MEVIWKTIKLKTSKQIQSRRIVDENPNADFIVMNGNRAMFKRKLFEKYVDEAGVIRRNCPYKSNKYKE